MVTTIATALDHSTVTIAGLHAAVAEHATHGADLACRIGLTPHEPVKILDVTHVGRDEDGTITLFFGEFEDEEQPQASSVRGLLNALECVDDVAAVVARFNGSSGVRYALTGDVVVDGDALTILAVD